MSNAAYEFLKRCPVCRREFRAARRKAIFCSDKCRQRNHRKPPMEKRIGEFYDNARDGIMALIAVTDRGFEGFRAQKRLQSLCVEIIQNVTDETRRIIYEQLKDDFFRLYRDNQMSRYRPEDEA